MRVDCRASSQQPIVCLRRTSTCDTAAHTPMQQPMTQRSTTLWCRVTRYGLSHATSLRCSAPGAQQTPQRSSTRPGTTAGTAGTATTLGTTRGMATHATRGTTGTGTYATAVAGASTSGGVGAVTTTLGVQATSTTITTSVTDHTTVWALATAAHL